MQEAIYNAEGVKLDPEATSVCENCGGEWKIKEMYKAGRFCDDCYTGRQ